MRIYSFVFQDCIARNPKGRFLKYIQQYFRIPGIKILIQYRLCQYLSKNGGGKIIISMSRLLLEHSCGKYCMTISEGLEAKAGLSFPHNGPFVINPRAKIGMNCTIHPQVLIGGDRSKGTPVLGNNVFVGNGAKIIGDCQIGNWVFIAPGAIVTKDIPDNSLVGAGLNNVLKQTGKNHVEMYLK